MSFESKNVAKRELPPKISDKNAIRLTALQAMRSKPIRIADASLTTLALCTSHIIKFSLSTVQARSVFGKPTGDLQYIYKIICTILSFASKLC